MLYFDFLRFNIKNFVLLIENFNLFLNVCFINIFIIVVFISNDNFRFIQFLIVYSISIFTLLNAKF